MKYYFERKSTNLLLTSLKGNFVSEEAEPFTRVWLEEIKRLQRPRCVCLDVTEAHPKGMEVVQKMATFLRNRTEIEALAFGGLRGPKLLIFRMLVRLTGGLPFHYDSFSNRRDACEWIKTVI